MSQTERITDIVKAVSKKSTAPSPEESLFDSGYLDSFALPDLATEIERQFKIRIPDADLNPRKFDTIERIDRYVVQAVARKAS